MSSEAHTASKAVLLASYSYKVHSTGRRTNAVEVLHNIDSSYVTNTLNWAFDGMYRLTNEVSLSSLSSLALTNGYVYDKVGNRLKKLRTTETITNQFNANDQLTTEASTVNGTNTYSYDANGSLTNKSGPSTIVGYAYNLANKLTSVMAGGNTTSYQYNDQGIRVRSVVGGSTQYFLVDANNHTGYAQVMEESAALGGIPTESYVIGDDVLAQCGTTGTDPRWLLHDGHGSTRQLLRNTTDITSQFHFDGYGVSLTSLGSNPETTHLYCGEQLDTTLQMYNLRSRYYDPSNARFNQQDTFMGYNDDPQSLHKYEYALQDAVNTIDPSGHMSLSEIIIWTAAWVSVITFYLAPLIAGLIIAGGAVLLAMCINDRQLAEELGGVYISSGGNPAAEAQLVLGEIRTLRTALLAGGFLRTASAPKLFTSAEEAIIAEAKQIYNSAEFVKICGNQ